MNGLDEVLERLAARRPRVIDLSLGRIETALSRLGDPHLVLPPVFHVAGSNGKGSTIAFLRAILEAAGKSVHIYTSPHLVRFNERVVLAGVEASDDVLLGYLQRCDDAVGDETLTYFETITCAAFLAFHETPADYLLLEVGLGGRLDATNVIERPLASIVTPVALDHQHYLGDRIELVAAEKAGIFKSGAPAVIGPQSVEAMTVLRNRAEAAGAPLFAFGSQWDVRVEQGRLIYQDTDGLSDLAAPRLFGAHQFFNAGTAIAAIRAAAIEVDDETLSAGIAGAYWPGRLQRLKAGPLLDLAANLLGEPPEIWLDGGHNPHAARAIANAMSELEERSPRRLVLITGMQDEKDAQGYFTAFADAASHVFTVKANIDGAAAADAITAAAERAGLPASPSRSVEDAMRLACRNGKAPRILICGSLYLAGEILRRHR